MYIRRGIQEDAKDYERDWDIKMKGIKEKYTLVSKPGDDWANVCICVGEFKDVVYNYGKVSVLEEENSDGLLPFRFEYNIIDNMGIPRDNFGENFITLIGDILVDIIDDQIKGNMLEYVADD